MAKHTLCLNLIHWKTTFCPDGFNHKRGRHCVYFQKNIQREFCLDFTLISVPPCCDGRKQSSGQSHWFSEKKSTSVFFDLSGFRTAESSRWWSFISIIVSQTTVLHTLELWAHIISMTITRLIKRLASYTTHNLHRLCQRLPSSYTHIYTHTHTPEGRATEADDGRSEGTRGEAFFLKETFCINMMKRVWWTSCESSYSQNNSRGKASAGIQWSN